MAGATGLELVGNSSGLLFKFSNLKPKEFPMKSRIDNEPGSMEALIVAMATLVRCFPAEAKKEFMTCYPENIRTWDETALFSPVSDEWMEEMKGTAAKILRVASSE